MPTKTINLDRQDENLDRASKLQILMSKVGIKTFKELYQIAGISERSIQKLRSGDIDTMQWKTLLKIATALQVSIYELVITFGDRTYPIAEPTINIDRLQQEYDRLTQQLQRQKEDLTVEFQTQTLQALESFLTYYPTAKQAAIDRPDFPATKILPLLKSVEQLIVQWGVTAIGSVGAEIPYDPQWHQLIAGTAHPGDLVKVRYVGYQQVGKLLFRAKVSNSSC
jgi:DNA-binding Xre family transcriptional regulator